MTLPTRIRTLWRRLRGHQLDPEATPAPTAQLATHVHHVEAAHLVVPGLGGARWVVLELDGPDERQVAIPPAMMGDLCARWMGLGVADVEQAS